MAKIRCKMTKNKCENTRMIHKMIKYRCKQPQRHAKGSKINTKLLNIDETTGKRRNHCVFQSGCQSGAFTCLCPGLVFKSVHRHCSSTEGRVERECVCVDMGEHVLESGIAHTDK